MPHTMLRALPATLLAVFIILASIPVHGITGQAVLVGDDIKVDTVWGPSETYIITANISVYPNATLRVLPGTEILFMPHTSLDVKGLVNITGAETAPVVVDGVDGNREWNITVHGGTILASHLAATWIYVETIQSGRLELTDSTISDQLLMGSQEQYAEALYNSHATISNAGIGTLTLLGDINVLYNSTLDIVDSTIGVLEAHGHFHVIDESNLTISHTALGKVNLTAPLGVSSGNTLAILDSTVSEGIYLSSNDEILGWGSSTIFENVTTPLIRFSSNYLGSGYWGEHLLIKDSSIDQLLLDVFAAATHGYTITIENSSIGLLNSTGWLAFSTANFNIIDSTIQELRAHGIAAWESNASIAGSLIGSIYFTSDYYGELFHQSRLEVRDTVIQGNLTLYQETGGYNPYALLPICELLIEDTTISGMLVLHGQEEAVSRSNLTIRNSTVSAIAYASASPTTAPINGSTIVIEGSTIGSIYNYNSNASYAALQFTTLHIADTVIQGNITLTATDKVSIYTNITLENTLLGGMLLYTTKPESSGLYTTNLTLQNTTVQAGITVKANKTILYRTTITLSNTLTPRLTLKASLGDRINAYKSAIHLVDTVIQDTLSLQAPGDSKYIGITLHNATLQTLDVDAKLYQSLVQVNQSHLNVIHVKRLEQSTMQVYYTSIDSLLKVEEESGSQLDATANWWGSPTGPYVPWDGWPGQGAMLYYTGEAQYSPWLTTPSPPSEPTAPSPSLTAPPTAETGQPVTLDASQSVPACGVLYYLYYTGDTDQLINTTQPQLQHTYTGPGAYKAAVAVVDSCGLAALAWTTINVTGQPIPPTPPNITITSPPHGAVTGDQTVTIEWTLEEAPDNPVTAIQVYVDGQPAASLPPDTVNYTLNLADGTHTITVQAIPAQGPPVNHTITVTVDTQPPTIQASLTTADNTATLTFNIDDPNLDTVTVTLNGETVYTTSQPHATLNLTLQQGTNQITVTAIDKAGNTATWTQNTTYNPPTQQTPATPQEDNTTTQQNNTQQTSQITREEGQPTTTTAIAITAALAAIAAITLLLLKKR